MSINFATLQGLTIPEGVVTQIADATGRVLWSAEEILEGTLMVKKITHDTYAGETTYAGEQFILLDIYPRTNGTVNVTYGDFTKTVTDTSGAVEPNAIQVFFGTFNGVSDSVATPASGALFIEGDCRGVGCGTYRAEDSKGTVSDTKYTGVTSVNDLGNMEMLPASAFSNCNELTIANISGTILEIPSNAFSGCSSLKNVVIGNGVDWIRDGAFSGCISLTNVSIPASVGNIGVELMSFAGYTAFPSNIPNPLKIDSKNTMYKIDGNCLIGDGIDLKQGFSNSEIPNYIEEISEHAFYGCSGLLGEITIPATVTRIYEGAFYGCSGLTEIIVQPTKPPIFGNGLNDVSDVFDGTTASIIVPAGCGDTYKATAGWSEYADRIVEAS